MTNIQLPVRSLMRALIVCTAASVTMALLGSSTPAYAQRKSNLAVRPEFREPVTLASKDGVLEVRLTARQGEAALDTVATPVKNFLLFDYEVIRGTSSNGKISGGNLYPAPTLQVFPGETLIVHLENGLSGLLDPRLLQPAIHAEGRGGSDLSGTDDLIAAEPSRSWPSRQSEGKFRQRAAAHPRRHGQYLHLQHPEKSAAGRVLVSQPSARTDRSASLYGSRGLAGHRTHRRQPAGR